MSFYNTGNPVPSIDPRDLDDNAKKFDEAINSQEEIWVDRLGATRKSIKGVENGLQVMEDAFDQAQTDRSEEFDQSQSDREYQFEQFLLASGYETPVDYAAGISITRSTQLVRYLGELYRPKIASLPFVTTTFAADSAKWIANGDNSLRQDLGTNDQSKGAFFVANSVRRIPDMDTLKLVQGKFDGDTVYLQGYISGWAATTRGALGFGHWRWSSSSTKTANGGTCVDVTGVATGRWLRIFGESISVEDFGAAGDYNGVVNTNDTDAFQRAFNNKSECSIIKLGKGANYYVDPASGFTGLSNITLIGVKSFSTITCGSATSLFNVSERCTFKDLQIGFTGVVAGQGPTVRVAFRLIDQADGLAAQFCEFSGISINSLGCGSMFYTSATGGCFNCSFANIVAKNFSYAAFNLNNPTRTQNVYSNIYMISDKQPPRMMQFLGEEVGSTFLGMNFEQSIVTGPVLVATNLMASFSNIHVEGIRMLGNNPILQMENCNIDIDNLDMYYCTFGSYVSGGATQTSGLIKFNRNTITVPPWTLRKPYLHIKNMNVKGINYRFEAGFVDGLAPPELTFMFVYGDVISGSGVKPLVRIDNYSYRTWISDFAKYSDFLVDDTAVIVSKPINFQTVLALAGAWRNPSNTTDVTFKYRYDPLMERTRVVAEFNLAYQDKATTQLLTLPAYLNPPDRKFFRAVRDSGGIGLDVRVGYSTVNIFNVDAAIGTGGALASASNRLPVTLEYYV